MTPVKNHRAHRAHRGVPELSRLQSKAGTLNITVTPSAHNSQAWLDIPQEIREDVTLQPLLLFPDLTSLCHQVIMEIRTKRLLGTTGSSTFTLERYSGDTGFANHLVSFVRPEIKNLEGKLVTRKHLDEIMAQQKSEDDGVVETSIGYLDYVVDSRDALYVRWYVGQSRSPRRRIISQHSQSMLRGENSSLHYFIIWLGNGYRSANFIKLWSFPNAIGDSDTNKDVSMRNILEAVFCRAFSTHHGSLTTWDKADGLQSGYGLNIMTPLVQSNAVSDIAIAVSKSQIHASKDPQIQY
jgi:hypothetical protein